jgi:hypothetical protein
MNKEQVVAVMIEFINNQNRVAAATHGSGVSLADVEQQIMQMQPQLQVMCSGIYEALANKGLIARE